MRHGARQALDIGCQRRIVGDVIGRMLADDVHNPAVGLLGVVKIGEAVGETGPEMKQRRCRPVGHPVVAVGRTGRHALEQAEHTTHAGNLVQCGHKMHLGRAGVGKTDVHATRDECFHQAFGTVH